MNIVLVFLLSVQYVLSARILGIFPIPSISHQVVFRKLYLELAKHGHELVVITPNPILTKEGRGNVTEIDVSFSYEFVNKEIEKLEIFQRGVVADVNTVSLYLYDIFIKVIKEQIKTDEVQKLIANKNQKFDLILMEAYFNTPLIFSHIFKAPVIQISSFHGLPENYEDVGALAGHLKYYPNFNRNNFRDLTFWETVIELYQEVRLRYEFWKVKREEDRMIRELFGPKVPSIDELKNNINMLFINTHALFDDNKPVPPSVVYLGAFHLNPVKELPSDLKDYLDSSRRGVVYVSFGSNVLPSRMDKELLEQILVALKKLPYDVLWRFDAEFVGPLPSNVKTQKWFPQRDLLMHPKVKVFVTQGGLQSTDEAIDAGVPLVGIPMLGDQYYNVNKYVELGIGLRVDAMTLKAEELVRAVNTVFKDDSYRQNIQKLRAVMIDQPMPALERAVWWTEHVLRHGGARHLRSPAANVSWAEYLMLDFFIPLILILSVSSFIFYSLVKSLFFRNSLKVKSD